MVHWFAIRFVTRSLFLVLSPWWSHILTTFYGLYFIIKIDLGIHTKVIFQKNDGLPTMDYTINHGNNITAIHNHLTNAHSWR